MQIKQKKCSVKNKDFFYFLFFFCKIKMAMIPTFAKYIIGVFTGACTVGAFIYALQYCFAVKFTELAEKTFVSIRSRIWPDTPVQAAQKIQRIVTENLSIAQKISSETLQAEFKILAKIGKTKKRLTKSRSLKETENLNKQLQLQEQEYNQRSVVSTLARSWVQNILKIRQAVDEVLLIIESVFKQNKTSIKDEDIQKLKEDAATKPQLYNDKIKELISLNNIVTENRNIYEEAKQTFDSKAKEYEEAKDKTKLEQSKADSFAKMVESEAKLKDSEDKLQQNISEVREFILMTLQIDSLVKIFSKVEDDIESSVKSVELTENVEDQNISKLLNMMKFHENNSELYGVHLKTIRNYAKKCSSALEFSNGETAIMWSVLVGLAEHFENARAVYRGYFPICHRGSDEVEAAAEELCSRNNIDFTFEDNNLKAETNVDSKSIGVYDMLIINTWYTYQHYKYDLNKYSQITNKYIILTITERHGNHDSDAYEKEPRYGDYSEFPEEIDRNKQGLQLAINDFLAENENWKLCEVSKEGFGITVLEKK